VRVFWFHSFSQFYLLGKKTIDQSLSRKSYLSPSSTLTT
jgi:hypothetical protein